MFSIAYNDGNSITRTLITILPNGTAACVYYDNILRDT